MSVQQPRTATYAPLNGSAARDEPAVKPAGAAPVDAEAALLAAENERLASLKDALWQTFQVSPLNPIRAPIVDLTMAYTDALRLQLKLRAAGKEQRAVAAKALAKSGIRSF